MNEIDDIEARLVDAGRRPVSGVDSRFADGLESSLRAVHAGLDGARMRSRWGRAGRLALVGVAAVIASVVVALALTSPRRDPVLALTAAVDTEVVLPDGTLVDGRVGLELPDGTVVRTGPGGRATAGGVTVPPDSIARVQDGEIVGIERGRPDAPRTTATTESTASTTSRPTTTTTTTTTTTAPPRPPATRLTTTTTAPERSTTTTSTTRPTTTTESRGG